MLLSSQNHKALHMGQGFLERALLQKARRYCTSNKKLKEHIIYTPVIEMKFGISVNNIPPSILKVSKMKNLGTKVKAIH